MDLSAQRGSGKKAVHIPIIDTYIHEWMQDEKADHQLAVFGDYGSGKSTLCQKLARDLAAAYLNDPNSSRIPILLNLRDFIGKWDLEAYITSFLDRECKVVNPRIELFRAMNEAGIFLMIFDGFDEMAVKVDADILETNLLEIEKLAATQKTKAMLTSRPEHFVSAGEEAEALRPNNLFATRAAQYEPLRILPWNEEQVELFLQKRVPLVKSADQPWTYYRDQIKNIGSLADLSQRPVLLDMIVKTLPSLISSGEAINLPNLYKRYLLGEMKRQKILKKRSFLLTDDDRLELLQELAVEIYFNTTQSITFTDAQKLVEKHIGPPKHDLEAHTRDFLTNSFLNRRDDEYRLSHKSILEYLVATRLNREIQSDDPRMFSERGLEHQIYEFLMQYKPSVSTLIKWLKSTSHSGHHDYLGMNAAHLLLRISNAALAGQDLSGTNLIFVEFSGADLRNSKLGGAVLTYADLTSARFNRRDIQGAKLDDTFMTFYIVKTEEMKKLDSKAFMKLADQKLKKVQIENLMYGSKAEFRGDIFWRLSTPVEDFRDLGRLRKELSSTFNTKVCIGMDELEEIAAEADSRKKSDRATSKRTTAKG